MNERLGSIPPVAMERRVQARREGDPRAPNAAPAEESQESSGLPGVVTAPAEQPDPRDNSGGEAAFVAQVLGQPGQRRGLRGGPETLEKARAAYLEAEWSGPADRRISRGRITRTDI